MKIVFYNKWVYLSICFLCLTNLCLATPSKIEFFQVGQGNCTLVEFKDNTDTLPPLLVDCGSTSQKVSSFHQKEGHDYKAKIISRVVRRIKEIITSMPNSSVKKLNIVISHADNDHHNLIKFIIKELQNTLNTLEIHYFLGGSRNDYNNEISKHPNITDTFTSNQDLDLSYGQDCRVLSAIQAGNDANTKSIVLRIQHPTNNRSVILTGDATQVTTNIILTENTAIQSVTILQAAHHGADSDGSNNVEWLQKINPELMVISAGAHAGYGHPRQKMLKNALHATRLRHDLPLHQLEYYSDWNFLDSFNLPGLVNHYSIGRASNDYVCALTTLGVLATSSQGDISFDFESGNVTFGTVTPVSYMVSSIPSSSPLSEQDSFKEMQKFLESTDKKETTAISFPPMTFHSSSSSSTVLKSDKFKTLIELVQPISGLVSLDLSRLKFEGPTLTSIISSLNINDYIPSSVQELTLPIQKGTISSPTTLVNPWFTSSSINTLWGSKINKKGLKFAYILD